MDAFTKSMAGTAIGIGSIGLVGESLKMVPKNMGISSKRNKRYNRTSAKPLIKGATNLMVGTALLSGASSMIK